MSAGGRTHSVPPFSLDLSVQVNLLFFFYLFFFYPTFDHFNHIKPVTVHGFVLTINTFDLRVEVIRQHTTY